MKKLNKILSVGLSLALCATMVAPGFAATFDQLRDAINYGTGVEGAIEVADGADSRTITILEDVEQKDAPPEVENDITNALVFNGTDVPKDSQSYFTNVTLNLNGYSIIGNGTSHVIVVEDGATLTVNGDGGSITGGKAFSGGGMNICRGSTVTLNDVKVTGNTADQFGGGGLYVDGSKVTLNNVEVSGNTAVTGGGGLDIVGGNVTLNNVEVIDNVSGTGGGGGIRAITDSNTNKAATVEITGGKIANNTVNGNDGGGLLIGGNGSKATLKDTEVSGNTADHGGGVEAYNYATVEIDGGKIAENTANVWGGGLYVGWHSNATLSEANVANNTATTDGGGGLFVADNSSLTLKDAELSGNKAVYAGGIEAYNATVEIDGGKIANNTATNNGGGILVEGGSSATIKDAEVTGNTSANGGGGGLYAYSDSSLTLKDTEVSGNKAGWAGGIAAYGATVEIDGGKIANNTASGNGGGIFVDIGSSATIKDAEVTGNKSNNGLGGGIGVYGAKVEIDGSKVANNSAGKRGDDLYGWGGAKLTLPEAGSMNLVLTQDGKQITGWYYDKTDETSHRWGDFYQKEGTNYDGSAAFALKAAHDQYFGAAYYTDENAGSPIFSIEAESGVEKGSEAKFTGPSTNPAREGYVFDGWEAVEGVDGNGKVTGEVKYVAQWREASSQPGGETIIEDQRVPLAGLFTRADAIGYLWEQTGSPEAELSDFPDVPEDHEWAVAIGWAQDMGIALPDQDGNFRPDDLVLRSVESLDVSPEGELQEFLDRYAVFAGIELAEDEHFYELGGAYDDVIMGEDAQVIFDAFFAALEAALSQAA